MNKLEVLDFWAPWCGPCRVMTPAVESLMEEYNVEGSNVEIKKVNVDTEPELTQKYGIRSIPTIVFVKDDVEVNRIQGAQTKAKISGMITESLA